MMNLVTKPSISDGYVVTQNWRGTAAIWNQNVLCVNSCGSRRESEGQGPRQPRRTRLTCKLAGNTGVWGRNKNGQAPQQPWQIRLPVPALEFSCNPAERDTKELRDTAPSPSPHRGCLAPLLARGKDSSSAFIKLSSWVAYESKVNYFISFLLLPKGER